MKLDILSGNFTLSGKWSPCHCTGTIKHNEEKIRKKLTLVKKDTQKKQKSKPKPTVICKSCSFVFVYIIQR